MQKNNQDSALVIGIYVLSTPTMLPLQENWSACCSLRFPDRMMLDQDRNNSLSNGNEEACQLGDFAVARDVVEAMEVVSMATAAAGDKDDDDDETGQQDDKAAKERLLQRLRSNTVKTLRLSLMSDPVFYADLAHELHLNDSITRIHLIGNSSSRYHPNEEEEQSFLTGSEWLFLLNAFQNAALRERVKRLALDALSLTELPLFVPPTLLWQFRCLQRLTLFVPRRAVNDYWRPMANAITNHPTLESIQLYLSSQRTSEPTTNDGDGDSIDCFVQALQTVSCLRRFVYDGTKVMQRVQECDSRRPWQGTFELAQLLTAAPLQTFQYNGLGFCPHRDTSRSQMDPDIDHRAFDGLSLWSRLLEALQLTSLVTLSLTYNGIHGGRDLRNLVHALEVRENRATMCCSSRVMFRCTGPSTCLGHLTLYFFPSTALAFLLNHLSLCVASFYFAPFGPKWQSLGPP